MKYRMNSLYLCVKDMGRAVDFYKKLLNADAVMYDEIYSIFEIEGFRLGLFAYEKRKEEHLFGSNCLPSLEVEDMEQFQKKLKELKSPVVFPLTTIHGNQVLEFEDSEGNYIEATTMLNRPQESLIRALWEEMDQQNWSALSGHFTEDAEINWPNTKERFCVDEWVRVNEAYPGNWSIVLERLEPVGDGTLSVACVKLRDGETALHVVSFFTFRSGRISQLTEYWGDDGEPPEWRRKLLCES